MNYKFVKDKDNIADYYVWSGGGYPIRSSLSYYNVSYETSQEQIISHDSSLKIIFPGTEWSWINLSGRECDINETYQAYMKIYNNSGSPIVLRLMNLPSYYTDINVPSLDKIQELTISIVTTTINGIRLQLNTSSNSIVYVDDVMFRKR